MEAHFIEQIETILPEISPETIISRKVFSSEGAKVTLFGFAPGEELTEHTASAPAVLHFLAGEAALTLGDDEKTAVAGSWAYMPAHLPHSILAKTAVTMLLYLLTE
jgi:quercetin dioxygenase-like cupin family protein